jgi:predicted DCC family thiol-disulfide oxidoreductase YuxK
MWFDRRFFTSSTDALNLAVFRIVFFSLIPSQIPWKRILFLSDLPDVLRIPPIGLEWLVPYLPMNPALTKITGALLIVFSIMGALGLFSRMSSFLTALLAFYVLGIDRFFGNVSHNHHHIIWFSLILSLSPCGDALSLDAIFAGWKRADRGNTAPPPPSNLYSLPLRFIWILLGILYFFPGYWKLHHSGLAWALSDNMKYQMYGKWSWHGWTPLFRMDQYPVLYKSAGLFTIFFELCFIAVIFFPPLRYVMVVLGMGFHTMTALFLNITFWSLLSCYVAFFDWYALFRCLGRWLYKEQMLVVYDGSCKLCRRTIASLRVFDILGRVTYLDFFDEGAIREHGLERFDKESLIKDMHAVKGEKFYKGFHAYRALAWRIPFLWPILPFFYLWPIPWLGKTVYQGIANSRLCQLKSDVPVKDLGWVNPKTVDWRPVLSTVVALMAGINIFLGFSHISDAWPFASFPDFRSIRGPQKKVTDFVMLDSARQVIVFDKEKVKLPLRGKRFRTLLKNIVGNKDEEKRRVQMKAILDLWKAKDPSLNYVKFIQVYQYTHWVLPERLKENPVKQKLLYEIEV